MKGLLGDIFGLILKPIAKFYYWFYTTQHITKKNMRNAQELLEHLQELKEQEYELENLKIVVKTPEGDKPIKDIDNTSLTLEIFV